MEKLNSFKKKVSDLPDKPTMEADELKAYFDAAPEELRAAFNKLIDALTAATAAASIGARGSDGADSNLQAALDSILAQLQGIALGQIPDGSITKQKLAFTAPTSSEIRADAAKPLMVEARTTDPQVPLIGQIWLRSDL